MQKNRKKKTPKKQHKKQGIAAAALTTGILVRDAAWPLPEPRRWRNLSAHRDNLRRVARLALARLGRT